MAKLSPGLFWDTDQESVRQDDHRSWLLSRVLEGGSWEDWLAIRDAYGKDCLAELEPHLRLDAKARNFLRVWLSI